MSWTNPRPKPSVAQKVPSFDIPELCSSDSEILSPFLDVAEACLSPTSPQAGTSSFSFSPVKAKNSLENASSKMNDIVVNKEQPQEQVSQSCESLEPKDEADKSGHEDSHLNQLRAERSDGELEVIFAKDSDEDGDLLTQIKDKRKELDELIKKWKSSRNQKAVIDLTTTASDGDNIVTKHKKDLSSGSSEIVEVMETLGKQHESSNVEGTENKYMQSELVIGDEKEGQEKVVDAVCVSESESETSSVEDVTASNKLEVDVVEVKNSSVSSDALHTAEVVEAEKSSVSAEALREVQTTLATDATADVVEDKKSSVSPDVLQVAETTVSTDATSVADQEDIDHSETQKYAELHVDSQQNEKMPVVEDQDSSEESRVEMVVDEPVAGPSGLPVEWQGATVVRQCNTVNSLLTGTSMTLFKTYSWSRSRWCPF